MTRSCRERRVGDHGHRVGLLTDDRQLPGGHLRMKRYDHRTQESVPNPMLLESYLQDIWVAPTASGGTAVDVCDAVTSETVCGVSSHSLDLVAAFDHARRVGGPRCEA